MTLNWKASVILFTVQSIQWFCTPCKYWVCCWMMLLFSNSPNFWGKAVFQLTSWWRRFLPCIAQADPKERELILRGVLKMCMFPNKHGRGVNISSLPYYMSAVRVLRQVVWTVTFFSIKLQKTVKISKINRWQKIQKYSAICLIYG